MFTQECFNVVQGKRLKNCVGSKHFETCVYTLKGQQETETTS